MARLIAFLRAINVGGHNVKMDHLRTLISGYGFDAVETFIASGNVIMDGGRRKPGKAESLLETGLAADLGYPVTSFVRTIAELADVVAADPFSAAPGRYYVTFLKNALAQESTARLLALRSEGEDFAVVGRELHWLVRAGFETQVPGAQVERAAGGPATARNISTIRRLTAKFAPSSR